MPVQTAMRLLAKSAPKGYEPKTLIGHTIDVVDAFDSLFGTASEPTALRTAWLRFFRLDDADALRFLRLGRLATSIHDLGKANDGFLAALSYRGSQLIRHEHLTGLLFSAVPSWSDWLTSAAGSIEDADIVLAAALSHHLRLSPQNIAQKQGDGELVEIFSEEQDFAYLADHLGKAAGIEPPPAGDMPRFWAWGTDGLPGCLDMAAARRDLRERLEKLSDRLDVQAHENEQRLMRAVRCGLIAADSAGSALPRTQHGIPEWIRKAFTDKERCTAEFIAKAVIEERKKEKGIKSLRRWQNDCRKLGDRALLIAPCGAGKTLAAWKWVEGRLAVREAGHVLFLYPTRATATEGFKDYVSHAPEADAALVHGTAAFDLDGLFRNPFEPGEADPRHHKQFGGDERLYALRDWGKRVFAATVDQFLAFVQYDYGSVCRLPVLADSVVVIDEVHSFDTRMFSALREFLKHCDVPVLCMTATLPPKRQKELEQALDTEAFDPSADPRETELHGQADHPRYRVNVLDAASENDEPPAAVFERVEEAIRKKQKVLWVVNTVDRAQAIVLRLANLAFADLPKGATSISAAGAAMHCYHSRFRTLDRRERHRAVLAAFKNARAVVAVTTQVCEMSLDLDADLLVTERAPITALVQRMGRCARHGKRTGDVLIYSPAKDAPYDGDDLFGVDLFLKGGDGLKQLDGATISQSELAERLADCCRSDKSEPFRPCQFFESGPYAMSGEDTFRDIEQFTETAVLRRDVAAYLEADKNKKEQPKYLLPVPRWPKECRVSAEERKALSSLPPYLAVARDDLYHPALGFRKPEEA
ncbi:MAG: CRISPR-associated helicase Cas3' [Planctomycetaceae bacterium]